MGIQVANSLHAAGTYQVTGEEPNLVRSQSPNGLIITKFLIPGETDIIFFQIVLDYPLEAASCAVSAVGLQNVDPETNEEASQAFVPFLIHINDKEKVLFLLEESDVPGESFDRNFHVQFTNYQANLREQFPVLTEGP